VDNDVDDDTEASGNEDGDEASNEDGDESSGDDSAATSNESPAANIEVSSAQTSETALDLGQTVTLDASRSSDPNGELVDYEWCVGNDGSFDETGKTIEVTVSAPGEHPVVLRVVDDGGSTATDRITLATNC